MPHEEPLSSLAEEHARYVADRVRLGAYRKALEQVVSPDSVVLDLGSGTGILGMLACRAGAAAVYSVDRSRMAEAARRVARESPFAERIRVLRADSRDVVLPTRANVVVADQMGPFGVGAGLVESFARARVSLLTEGAAFLPRRLTLRVGLATAPDAYRVVSLWDDEIEGLDLKAVRGLASSTPRWVQASAVQLVGEPAVFQELDLRVAQPARLAGSLAFTSPSAATVHGLAGWFVAELAERIFVTNDPLSAERIDREVLFLPFEQPLSLRAGQRVDVRLHVDPDDMSFTWQTRVETQDASCIRFDQSSLGTQLLTSDDLRRTAQDHAPQLNERGQAFRTVIDACDGAMTLSQLAAALQERFPARFAERSLAERFVVEVLERVSR